MKWIPYPTEGDALVDEHGKVHTITSVVSTHFKDAYILVKDCMFDWWLFKWVPTLHDRAPEIGQWVHKSRV